MADTSISRLDGDAHHNVVIKVDDSEIVFSNFILDENLADANQFNFTWKNDFNDNFTDNQEEFIEKFIGKRVVITLDENHTFKGVILEISFFQNDGLTQEFLISGQGLPVLLNDQVQSASYYKKSLKDIITDSLKGIPSNQLSIDCRPFLNSPLFYTVQYSETDFNFIKNLAVRYGEWFFFNGEKLIFGELEGEMLELDMGTDVYDARVSSSIKPFGNNSATYDHFRGEEATTKDKKPATRDFFQTLFNSSSEAFERVPSKFAHIHQSPTEDILNEQVELGLNAKASRMITFSAKSFKAEIKIGSTIKVNDGPRSNEYVVVQVQHQSITADSYSNYFTAIPSGVKVPPYTNPKWFPKCEPQPAIVKENVDKDGHDRVKVHFPWQQKNEMTPWLRIQNPYAGKGKGFRFVPEKNEEVLVGFENGNAERPYVIGAMYHGAAKSGHNSEGNHIKVFRTIAGCRLMMNDKSGSVKLIDKAGSSIVLNGSGDIIISAVKNLKLISGENSSFDVGKNSTFTVAEKYEESIGTEKKTDVGTNEEKMIGQKYSITIGQDVKIQAGVKMELEAGMDMEFTAGSNLKESAGMNLELNAGIGLKAVAGVQLGLEGGATADLKAGAMTTIKGGMVMIN